MFRYRSFLFAVILLMLFQGKMHAQGFGPSMNGGQRISNNQTPDSLKRRDKNEDSITIYFKYYNNNQILKLDTSINDFFVHYPVPYTSFNLGNLGTATKSYLFNANKIAGYDAGFHSFDPYLYTLEETPFYQTTRPFTEFAYLLGGKGEQLVEIKHTQNKQQQLNYSFEYRFNNAPGNVKNQNANVNNMRITAHYQSKRKRYESYLVMLFNKTASSENGGLVNINLLDSLALNDPYELDTRLGISGASFRNPFNTKISTGTNYKQNTVVWKNSYDFGQKDSIVKDTIVTHFFYPRIRLQNEIKLLTNEYAFGDINPSPENYLQYFGAVIANNDTVKYSDTWKVLTNEFSVISYPDKMNSNQFLQLGLGYTQMTASYSSLPGWSNYDLYGFAVYKNKTKNQLWDLLASGKLYLNGFHAGDYDVQAALSRTLTSKGTYLKLSFQNVNRTPSLNTLGYTQFPIKGFSSINKENATILNGVLANKKLGWEAAVSYQMIQNYNYYTTGFQPVVNGNLMSYLRGQVEHKIKISKHWNWYDQVTLQLLDPNAPVHVPLLLIRERVAFEGNFFKNLDLSTGLELIYHTNYKVDGYMPFTSQFYYQNSYTTQNRPTANAFLHFMIKRFKGYIRLENLNTLLPTNKTFGKSLNFNTQNYPSTGMWFRVGIWWNFIN